MCGIAGIGYKTIDPVKNIIKMNETMIRRGPDAGDYHLEESMQIVLGHRRLSILDLSPNGAQPMESKDKRYVMVYNGEVYNGDMIKEQLLKDGHFVRLRGTSDTELLLEAISCYGLDKTIALAKGMFAIGLLDREERTVTLVRDRMGEKPLYYGMVNSQFVFASDLNCIKSIEGFSNPVNQNVLPLYFQYGYIPAPYTIYEGIYQLQPGKMLVTKQPYVQHDIHAYWDIAQVAKKGEENQFKGSEEEAINELERLLKESIKGQMVADVPLGAFLSGGIDSTLVVALMQSMSEQQVKTFTIGMEEAGYNEAHIAMETSKHLETKHEELYVGYKDVMELLPKLSKVYGEPFADSSQLPTMLVSQMTKKHVTVSLSGDGGDELFCGYNAYLSAQKGLETLQSKASFLKGDIRNATGEICKKIGCNWNPTLEKIGNVLRTNTLEDYKRSTHTTGVFAKQLVKGCAPLDTSYLQYKSGFLHEDEHNLMLMDQMQYLPDDILTKVDRAGMYYSLETRIPLLDRDVVSFAWSLPLSYAFDGQVTKKALRSIVYKYVPRELLDRPKTGFAIPVGQWLLSGTMNDWAESLMEDARVKAADYIDQKIAMKMWNKFKETKQYTPDIWYLLMMQQWMLEH